MMLGAKHPQARFRAMLLSALFIFLVIFAFAAPIKDVALRSTLSKRDFYSVGFETVSRWLRADIPQRHQAHLHTRANDVDKIDIGAQDYAWQPDADGHRDFYAYGSKDHKVQYGYIKVTQSSEGSLARRESLRSIYDAVLSEFKSPVTLQDGNWVEDSSTEQKGLLAKKTKGFDAYHGGRIIEYLDNDVYLPKVYKKTVLLNPTGSLVVMEKLAEDADSMWSRYRYMPFDRLEMMKQATKGLIAAHEKGVIHLDIRPGNLMLVSYNVPLKWKIIDWDVAIALNWLGKNEKRIFRKRFGTEGFMSPEMVAKKWEEWKMLQDVYGLAMTLLDYLGDAEAFQKASKKLTKRTIGQRLRQKFKGTYPYKSRSEALEILKESYKPDLTPEGARKFWDFMASCVCGPLDRRSLEDFASGLDELIYIPDLFK